MNEEIKGYLQKNYTPQTAKAYIREIEIFITNNPNSKKYRYADVVNYIGVLRSKYNNSKTINRILSSIKAYYSYLCSTNQRKDNPTKAIKLRDKISRDIQLQDLFTPQELEILLNRKERYTNLEHRNNVLMSLMIYQGLQPRELANIKLTDINLKEATIYIKATNNTNGRTLPLKANQILLFQFYQTEIRKKLLKEKETEKYLVGIRGNDFTEVDITSHLKHNYKTLFANRKVNAKTIRQSVITNLLKQNNDLRIVQSFAGHKYTSTTERYRQNDVELLQAAVNKYHPLQ
ncbi:MAG: tyrosine-type recombinase/integrase [Ferruginibacter sp.]